MGMKIEGNDFFEKHEAYGNRELKYYKDIYGNDVRLMTTPEKSLVNKGLIVASVVIVVLLSSLFYKAYLVQKEVKERTKLYMMAGESLNDGQDIVKDGGVIVSDDSEVVKVENDGTIIAQASGTTNVTVYKNIDENDFSNASLEEEKGEDKTIYDMYNDLGVEGEFTFEVTVQQNVTGVSLNMPTLDLYVGETNKIMANVFPHTSYNKDTTWTSSNNSVATVDRNGVVTARSVGSTTITVVTKDGGFRDSTLVTVSKKESKNSIYLSLDNKELLVGENVQLITVVSPNEKLLSNVVYSSSDSSVATVDFNGKISLKKAGKTTITARIASENISSSIDIIVKEKELEKISIASNNYLLSVGDSVNLKYYLYPVDVKGNVTYNSSDSTIASVDSNGTVTALKDGVTTITIKGNNNVVAECLVEVRTNILKVSSLETSIEKNAILVGEDLPIKTDIYPIEATDKKLTYVSTDLSVASVSSDGVVMGVKPGQAYIIVTATSGVSSSIPITVNETDIVVEKLTTSKNIDVVAGKSLAIDTEIYPVNATNTTIIWSSSDENIAKVSSDGVVTGVKNGQAIVTAAIDGIISSTVVNVSEIKVEEIKLNFSNVRLFIGEDIDLKSSIYPANTTNPDIVWTSSDESIVIVDAQGNVKALKEGTALVKAISSSNPNIYSECGFTVSKIGVESYKLSHNQILVTEGKTVSLSITDLKPSNASYQNASYKIDDEAIASVDNNGLILGLKPGKTKITVTVDDITKTLDLTVFETGDKVYFIDTYTSLTNPSDAILIESNGKYAMIDTGSTVVTNDVIKFLKDLGVKRLEFILITHFHSASFGGLYGENTTNNILLSDIKVGKVYMKPYSGSDSYFKDTNGKMLDNTSDIINRRQLRSVMFTNVKENIIVGKSSFVAVTNDIKKLTLGNFNLDLYNTSDQLKNYNSECLKNYNCNENSNSIVTYVTVNGKTLYLAGDIYNAYNDKSTSYLKTKTEISVAEDIAKDKGNSVDIYKVSNYGDNSSNVEEALMNINPNYSIITNSRDNFDLDSESINRIDKYTNKDIYYAGDGTVVVNINNEGNINFVQLND